MCVTWIWSLTPIEHSVSQNAILEKFGKLNQSIKDFLKVLQII